MTTTSTDPTATGARTDVPALPTATRLPATIAGLGFLTARRRMLAWLTRGQADAVTLRLPGFGDTVLISDVTLAKQLCATAPGVAANIKPNLGRTLGSGSIFNLEGTDHRRRRKLLTPPLHGRRIKGYEAIVAEEFARESASWPIGTPFACQDPMMRITLNVILRAVFGADGVRLDTLRTLMPPLVEQGSRLSTMPELPTVGGRFNPRNRFVAHRKTYDTEILSLIAAARRDPMLADRDDILALMLCSRYEDGSPMTDSEIADELLTLLAAGHETTATTLAWALERITRHPGLLAELTAEAAGDDKTLRIATIHEVQRARPVIDLFGRHVVADHLDLGRYRIPKGYNVVVAISLLHDDGRHFHDPDRFDPHRFVDARPDAAWLPFGGGTRRCIGAAFAHMEMDIVLRELLRSFTVAPSSERPERWHSRGVASGPAHGGVITVSPAPAAAAR